MHVCVYIYIYIYLTPRQCGLSFLQILRALDSSKSYCLPVKVIEACPAPL